VPETFEDETVDLDVLNRELLLEGRIFSVVRESFAYNGLELSREFVTHPGAVAVIAVDDENRVLLIKQYRHPIRSRDWEIPAGLLDVAGEPMLAAAQRELAEEADLAATEWSVLVDLATSPGGSDEFVRVFLARGLSATLAAFDREDEEADLELRWVPIDEVVDAIARGSLRNSILIAGVLATQLARSRDWSQLRGAEPSEL
jgi:ADP-ribose pyrophosphatase